MLDFSKVKCTCGEELKKDRIIESVSQGERSVIVGHPQLRTINSLIFPFYWQELFVSF